MRMTMQEWTALSPEDQRSRAAEMPWEVFEQQSKAEQERLTNLNIEKDRKLKAALVQVDEFDKRIKALESSGAPASQIRDLEAQKRQFQEDYEKDPTMAIARLAQSGITYALDQQRQADAIKRQALRKIRAEYSRDYAKYGDELEDKLDAIRGPISVDDVLSIFNSLRGKSKEDEIKEAEARGAKKALEEAGIVAVDEGGSSGDDKPKGSSLTQEQQAEMTQMGLNEKEYKELLRGRQEEDKRQDKTPRVTINPKH